MIGDVRHVAAVLVDLLVQMLSQVFAAWKSVNRFVLALEKLAQLAAVSTFAVELRVAPPIGWGLRFLRGACA